MHRSCSMGNLLGSRSYGVPTPRVKTPVGRSLIDSNQRSCGKPSFMEHGLERKGSYKGLKANTSSYNLIDHNFNPNNNLNFKRQSVKPIEGHGFRPTTNE